MVAMYQVGELVVERIFTPKATADSRVKVTEVTDRKVVTATGNTYNQFGINSIPYRSIRSLKYEHGDPKKLHS